MSAEPAGRVLIASNRGPVSFSLGDDGKLTSTRLYVEKDGIKPPM